MRIFFIVFLLIISGCKTIERNNATLVTSKKNSNASSKHAVYNRYKNSANRYTIQQDAAPKRNKLVNFKEPIPTTEPLSRYGNPTEYSVAGHKYQVLKTSHGYKARGMASWYGTKFHQQRTSSGEAYNMYVMTAAHKTLPLPTYIRVKNLNNGRVAIVKVNDRGPFHANRVIDLSYAAALKLGVFPKGTAPVEIETIKGPLVQTHYYLQAGTFSSQSLAYLLKSKLGHLTTSPVLVERYKHQYIVRIGPFAAKTMADNLKKTLASKGVSGTFSVLI